MFESHLQAESLPIAGEGSKEFDFNFYDEEVLTAVPAPVRKDNAHLSKAQLEDCVRNRRRVFFKIDSTSQCPGVLVKGRPFVHFLVASSHPFAATMPVTPLTLSQAQKFVVLRKKIK
jgi:hypothetical protein